MPSPGGWSVFWNELLDGAPPNRHQSVAAAATRLGELMTPRTSTARWFDAVFKEDAAVWRESLERTEWAQRRGGLPSEAELVGSSASARQEPTAAT